MRIKDLHELPKVRDSWTYLYVEHCRVDQESKAIAIHDQYGVTPVPCASLCLLMLGPGTKITHTAIMTLVDNGCSVVWCGEQGVRFYAFGTGETRQATNLLKQASFCSNEESRLDIVRKMYAMRFADRLDESLSLQQIRGMEGVRVRDAYARWSEITGVPWHGRNYNRQDWNKGDNVNRALSAANSCLYGVCHAAIVSLGYSPGLGFIHTGKQLSFVYDVADLYKVDITVPIAFRAAKQSGEGIERKVRHQCRDVFEESQILQRIVADIERLFDQNPSNDENSFDTDPAKPGQLWDPNNANGVEGGVAYDSEDKTEENET
jgi:CRISPR-associated protein Cas1